MADRIVKKLFDPLAMGWGRTPVVWRWRNPQDDFDYVRMTVARYFNPRWNRRFPQLSRILYFYMLAVWPIRALIETIRQVSRNGISVKKARGLGYAVQAVNIFTLALVRKIEPQEYYLYRYYDKESRKHAGKFLTTVMQTALFDLINDGISNEFTENKLEFNRYLAGHGIPVVPTLEALNYEGSQPVSTAETLQLPARDFIAKPNSGMDGRGIFGFENLGSEKYRCQEHGNLTADEVRKQLARLAGDQPYLLQPWLRNHPDIAQLSGGGLSTARVITSRTPDGAIKLLTAVFKMQLGTQVADSFNETGIVAPVDPLTGELGPAIKRDGCEPGFARHPVSGAPIVGCRLPRWEDCIASLERAHSLLPDYAFLGWDVGFTSKGPILIEANVMFSPAMIQQAHQYPLGRGEFAGISRQWLQMRLGSGNRIN